MNEECTITTTDTAPTEGLPTSCPPWCPGGHEQALDEGCTIEEARVHTSGDIGTVLARLSNPYARNRVIREGGGSWRAVLHADHAAGWEGRPYVHLVVTSEERPRVETVTLPLTTAEALEMARVLTHFAEQGLLTD